MAPRRIGVISDTHGLLRPEALDVLAGVEQIIHAGDVGTDGILGQLYTIAPVTAVRGNVDNGPWARNLPATATVTVDEVSVFVLHDVQALALNPAQAGHRVVVSGHSHRPLAEERDGVLFLNPGSAGPRRFNLPISLALLEIEGRQVAAQIVEIAPAVGGPQ